MNKKENSELNINDIIACVKLVSLLLCCIIVFNHFTDGNKDIIEFETSYFNLRIVGMALLLIMLTYCLWVISSDNKFKTKHKRIICFIENIIFIFIFSVLILYSGANTSEYKFLYLFIIIAVTLQSGMREGMTIAIISSAIILMMDLIYLPGAKENINFENDLIIVGVFILTAWPLGYYVKAENERLNLKNIELETLNNELKIQDMKRKKMENILLKSENCYNLLIENAKGSIFIHRDDKLIFVNESAVKLIGVKDEKELTGENFLKLIKVEDNEEIEGIFSKIYDEKVNVLNFEGKVKKNNGEFVAVNITSTYITYEGKPAIVSILYDISSEKQIEQLKIDVEKNTVLLNETREFNKSITELFANISHELKTPLNVIYSAVQVLDLYKDSAIEYEKRKTKYLKVMKQNCYRLMRLINNFLDMTKLDSGFIKINMRNYDIVKVVEDITLSVASYIESKDVRLIFDTNIEEKIMSFDPDKVERIMLNLLSNAVKYSKPGGEIFVNFIDDVNKIYISVKDNGLGVPEDKIQMIFERFGQVDKTLQRVSEGTGIGLSLVKSFVEMHNGSIELKSELNVGSEFTIMLPAKIIPDVNECSDKGIHQTNIERIDIEFSDIYSDIS
jgi:PAS domain S-box